MISRTLANPHTLRPIASRFCLIPPTPSKWTSYVYHPLSNIDFTNYADDTTPYIIGDGLKEAIDSFRNTLTDLFCWIGSNQIKANLDKYHLIASCDNKKSICVNNYNITNN